MPVSEMHRKRRTRNLVLAGILAGVVILFFAMTMAKLASNT